MKLQFINVNILQKLKLVKNYSVFKTLNVESRYNTLDFESKDASPEHSIRYQFWGSRTLILPHIIHWFRSLQKYNKNIWINVNLNGLQLKKALTQFIEAQGQTYFKKLGNTHIFPDFSHKRVKGIIHSHSRLGRGLDERNAVIPAKQFNSQNNI